MHDKSALAILFLITSLLAIPVHGETAQIRTVPAPKAPPTVLSGHVVVRADEYRAVIALDEEDAAGELDGRVDHLFSVFALDLVLQHISLDDALGQVEYQQGALRVVLPTEKRELEFKVFTFDSAPWRDETIYPSQVFENGLQLFHYSGEVVQQMYLEDVMRLGTRLLSYTDMADLRFPLEDHAVKANPWGEGKSIVEPFDPSPDPTDGTSGCNPTCKAPCAKGTCSASCRIGHCAKCACLTDPAGTPFCTCA